VLAQLNDDGRRRESRENIDIFALIEEAEDGHLSLIRTGVSGWVKFGEIRLGTRLRVKQVLADREKILRASSAKNPHLEPYFALSKRT
jgi:hypothetical protein